LKKICKDLLLYWMPVIIYCVMIYIQSSQAIPESLPAFTGMDKMLHFFGYALLGVLFFRAFNTLRIKDNKSLLILTSIVAATLYGISDEIQQYFVVSRDAEIADAAFDMLGSIFGVYVYQFLFNIRYRK
jgi:VanZ family protein